MRLNASAAMYLALGLLAVLLLLGLLFLPDQSVATASDPPAASLVGLP
jgi:hypothetical protein